ncbi:MAG TPA: thiosulfate oxidation carrier complex protein SoxZ [Hyphomicrobiaceae bacterium]|nr:thiosulfate oxidation carrier complex protein SoxZ [Hyphomicrobiaceae bacterium]
MPTARIVVPHQVKKGEIFEIKTLITHDMETGYRRDSEGRPIPRDILNRLVVRYDNEEIFSADLFPGVSANPYVAFTTVATTSGEMTFAWTDDSGATYTEKVAIKVV